MQGLSFLFALAVAIGFVQEYVLGTYGVLYNGLRVKYNATNENGFIKIPRTIAAAVSEGYIKTQRPPGFLPELIAYCPTGRAVCPLFHPNGFICGLQIAFLKEEISSTTFNLTERFVEWCLPSVEDVTVEKCYYASSQYYISEELYETEEGPTEANGSTLQYDGVWVEDIDGILKRIPLLEVELNATIYIKQNCIPKMGTHYMHNMTKENDCTKLRNWFAVLKNGTVHSVSYQILAELKLPSKGLNYYERYNSRLTVERTLPLAPECLYELSEIYTLLSMHVYFIDDPMSITCSAGDSVGSS